MKKNYWIFWSLFIIGLLFSACGLERDINLKLPEYERKLVVECYLERGQPIRLLLTESQPFLDNDLKINDIKDAVIVIRNNEKTYHIPYRPMADSAFGKVYNYTSDETIPINPEGEFTLEITDSKWRKITATTKFLEPLPINEINWEFEDKDDEIKEDSAEALLLIRHPVSPSGDYYRFIVNKKETENYSNQIDFIYKGITATNNEISVGTSYRFKNKDTLQVMLFHIERQFYDYIRSIEDARDAAGNPFAQPSPIFSAVNGGIGIFTTIQKDARHVVVTK